MKRVLHVVGQMNRGGLETLIMEIYRQIDRNQIQFDFAVHHPEDGHYANEIRLMGGQIFALPAPKPQAIYTYQKAWRSFFKEYPYEIIHGHMDSTVVFYLREAKKANVSIRIAHGHSVRADQGWKTWATLLTHRNITKYANVLFACSEESGVWMYGEKCVKQGKVQVIPNGIDTKEFAFSMERRNQMRQLLSINDDMVVYGHVGRFDSVKNHRFLLDVFDEIHHNNPNSRLLLVGDGPLRLEMEAKVKQFHLEQVVNFLGVREDVSALLQAMDVFVFPSLYEGLPLSLVEAQTAGLPCFLSDAVPRDAAITDLVEFVPLSETATVWAQTIQKQTDEMMRINREYEIAQAGYDIRQTADRLQEFYLSK